MIEEFVTALAHAVGKIGVPFRQKQLLKGGPPVILPRQIPMQKEESGEALLAVERQKTGLIVALNTAVDKVKIERKARVVGWLVQGVFESLQELLAYFFFRRTALCVVALDHGHPNALVVYQQLLVVDLATEAHWHPSITPQKKFAKTSAMVEM